MGLLGIDASGARSFRAGTRVYACRHRILEPGQDHDPAFHGLRRNVRHHQRHRPVQDPRERLWAAKRRTAGRGSQSTQRAALRHPRQRPVEKHRSRFDMGPGRLVHQAGIRRRHRLRPFRQDPRRGRRNAEDLRGHVEYGEQPLRQRGCRKHLAGHSPCRCSPSRSCPRGRY